MVSRQKVFTTLILLLSAMLILAACVRTVPGSDTPTATPDPNVGGGTDGAPQPTPGGDTTQPTPGGEQPQPTPGGDTTQPTPGGEQPQPTPAGEQPQPTPEPTQPAAGGDQTQPPATGGQPDQGGGTVGTPPTQEVIHTVQPGENLFRIGLQYGYSWVVLAQYNGIPNPNYVVVGQQIRIPPASGGSSSGSGGQPSDGNYTYYVVQPGDNLFRIGLKYGISWVWIAEANGITNPNFIVPGQVLKIPVS